MKYLSVSEMLALLKAHRYESNTMFTEWLVDNPPVLENGKEPSWWDGVPPNPQFVEHLLNTLYTAIGGGGLRLSCINSAITGYLRVRKPYIPACRITHHDLFVVCNIVYEEPNSCDSAMLRELYDFCTKHSKPRTLTYTTKEERDALVVDYLKMCNPDEPVDSEVIADYNKAFPIQ